MLSEFVNVKINCIKWKLLPNGMVNNLCEHSQIVDKMGDINSWVSDKLHELVGISDRSIAEFMVGLCKKSKSPSEFLEKIRDTGTIDVDDKVP